MAPKKRKSEEKKQEKTEEGKQNKPVRERSKGIVIKEVVPANSETKSESVESTDTTRKGVFPLSFWLEGLEAEKGKEKISETGLWEVCKRAKLDIAESTDTTRKGVSPLSLWLEGLDVDVAPALEKTEAEKGKEKISETDSKEVCKRAKKDDGDESDDSDGDEEKKQEKTEEGKQNKPVRERSKGIVIKEVVPANSETKSDTAESTAKKGTTRKREFPLRFGLEGLGVDVAPALEKTEAEKGKDKISETDSKEVCKRAKKDDGDDPDDSDGDGSQEHTSAFNSKKLCEDFIAGNLTFI